jgi:protein SCO1/2
MQDAHLVLEPTGAPKRAPARPRRWVWPFAVPVALVLAVGFGVPLVRFLRARGHVEVPVLATIDGFSLVDQHGRAFSLDDLRGKVWVADFVFTGCQAACPMLTSRMRTLQRHLLEHEKSSGGELAVRLVSFSVDPEVDTPEKLAAYADKWGADDRLWIFLTGKLDEMNRAVVKGMKIPFEKGGADLSAFDVMHGEHLVLVDASGKIRGYFEADPAGLDKLERAIRTLVAQGAAR